MRAGKIEALRRIATESVHPGEREAARRALDREAEKVQENLKGRTHNRGAGGFPKDLEDILRVIPKWTPGYEEIPKSYSEEMFEEVLRAAQAAYQAATNASRAMPKEPPSMKFTGRNAIFMAETFATKVRVWMTNNLNKQQIGYYNFNLNSAVEDIAAAVRSGAAFTALQIRKTIINFTFGDADLGQHDLVNQEAVV